MVSIIGMQCPITAEDALCATSVATLQMLRKVARQRNGDHGGKSKRSMRERWADGVHGLMGEIALAHGLNLPWTPGGLYVSRGDVAQKVEVRATEHRGGHLLIYDNDDDDAPFVLMIGHYPLFRVAGWMRCGDAKQDEWWRDNTDPPCWWVPQNALGGRLDLLLEG